MKKVLVFFVILSVPALLFSLFWTARPAASAAPVQEIAGVGAPWYHSDWHYRRPVTVTNSGAAIVTNYQVLVTLDEANFNFTQAKSDGTDLRVTDSDGLTELPFWIESWSSTLAYVWIKFPSVPAGTTVAAAYLYFGYADAVSASDGATTFNFFDDNWWAANPVQFATQAWWEKDTSYPMVFEDTSFAGRPRYHMLYDGHNQIGHAKGYATSPDLNIWTEYDGGAPHPPNPNPIMGTGYVGNAAFAWGDAVKVGSTYYMFPSRGPGTTERVESTDLISWTNFTTLVEDDPGGNIGTGAAILKEPDGITPVVVDGQYWMVYFHGGSPGTMYMASSTDLVNWSYIGALLAPTTGGFDAGGLWTPSFIRFGDSTNGMYYIYYQGLSPTSVWETGYGRANAYSGGLPIPPDPVSTAWSKSDTNDDGIPDSVLKRGGAGSWDSAYAIDPIVRQFSDGVYYLFYTGTLNNGYATASAPEGPWTKLSGAHPLWTIPIGAGSPSSAGGILRLNSSTAIQSVSTFRYQAVGYRALFPNNANTNSWGGFIAGSANDRTMIGTRPVTGNTSIYLRNYKSGGDQFITVIPGSWLGGFHVFEVYWTNLPALKSTGVIDHGLGSNFQTTYVPEIFLPVTFYNYSNPAAMQVDWVYIRQYRDPDPTTSVRAYSDFQETVAVSAGENNFDWVYSSIFITDTSTLTSVQIILYLHNHPDATALLQNGRYWEIIPNTGASGYTLSLTLHHSRVPDANDRLCYFTDPGWACDATSFDPAEGTITLGGLTHLSEWAVEENSPTAINLLDLRAGSKSRPLWLAVFSLGLAGAAAALGVFRHYRKLRQI